MCGGMKELLDGLVLVQELNARFWDTMYPPLKRPRTRGNSVSWYSDSVAATVAAWNVNDRDLALAIDQVSRAIDSDMRDKLGEAYVAVRLRCANRSAVSSRARPHRLHHQPRRRRSSRPPRRALAALRPRTRARLRARHRRGLPRPADRWRLGRRSRPDQIVDAETASNVLGELAPLFRRAGRLAFEADKTDPNGYRLRRLAGTVTIMGDPAESRGRTFFNGPSMFGGDGLTGLHASGDWSTLLQSAEDTLDNLPLWLDAARYAALALENLGEEYARARNAVVRDLAALLARAPRLPELQFDDGTPFASDETKAWIESAVLSGGGGSGGGGAAAAGSPIDKATAEAKKFATEGDLPRGMTMLSKAGFDRPIARATLQGATRAREALSLAGVERNRARAAREPRQACRAPWPHRLGAGARDGSLSCALHRAPRDPAIRERGAENEAERGVRAALPARRRASLEGLPRLLRAGFGASTRSVGRPWIYMKGLHILAKLDQKRAVNMTKKEPAA